MPLVFINVSEFKSREELVKAHEGHAIVFPGTIENYEWTYDKNRPEAAGFLGYLPAKSAEDYQQLPVLEIPVTDLQATKKVLEKIVYELVNNNKDIYLPVQENPGNFAQEMQAIEEQFSQDRDRDSYSRKIMALRHRQFSFLLSQPSLSLSQEVKNLIASTLNVLLNLENAEAQRPGVGKKNEIESILTNSNPAFEFIKSALKKCQDSEAPKPYQEAQKKPEPSILINLLEKGEVKATQAFSEKDIDQILHWQYSFEAVKNAEFQLVTSSVESQLLKNCQDAYKKWIESGRSNTTVAFVYYHEDQAYAVNLALEKGQKPYLQLTSFGEEPRSQEEDDPLVEITSQLIKKLEKALNIDEIDMLRPNYITQRIGNDTSDDHLYCLNYLLLQLKEKVPAVTTETISFDEKLIQDLRLAEDTLQRGSSMTEAQKSDAEFSLKKQIAAIEKNKSQLREVTMRNLLEIKEIEEGLVGRKSLRAQYECKNSILSKKTLLFNLGYKEKLDKQLRKNPFDDSGKMNAALAIFPKENKLTLQYEAANAKVEVTEKAGFSVLSFKDIYNNRTSCDQEQQLKLLAHSAAQVQAAHFESLYGESVYVNGLNGKLKQQYQSINTGFVANIILKDFAAGEKFDAYDIAKYFLRAGFTRIDLSLDGGKTKETFTSETYLSVQENLAQEEQAANQTDLNKQKARATVLAPNLFDRTVAGAPEIPLATPRS